MPLDREGFVIKGSGGRVVDLPPGYASGPSVRFGAGLGWPLPGGHRQDLVEPPPAFGQMAALMPESPQRAGGLLRHLRFAGIDGPAQGSPQVASLAVQRVEPLSLVDTGQVSLGLHRKMEKVLAVAPAHTLQFVGG